MSSILMLLHGVGYEQTGFNISDNVGSRHVQTGPKESTPPEARTPSNRIGETSEVAALSCYWLLMLPVMSPELLF